MAHDVGFCVGCLNSNISLVLITNRRLVLTQRLGPLYRTTSSQRVALFRARDSLKIRIFCENGTAVKMFVFMTV